MTDEQIKYIDINEAAEELGISINGVLDLCSQMKLKAYAYFDLKFKSVTIFDGENTIVKKDVKANGYYNVGRLAALKFLDDNSSIFEIKDEKFNFILAETEYLGGCIFKQAHEVSETMLDGVFSVKLSQLKLKRKEIEYYNKFYKGKSDMQSKSLIAKKQKWDRVKKLVNGRKELQEWLSQSPGGPIELHHKFKKRLIGKLIEEGLLDFLSEKNHKTLEGKVNTWLKEFAMERNAPHLIFNQKTAKKE